MRILRAPIFRHDAPGSDKRGAKVDELHLAPLELITRIAALVAPPRTAKFAPEHQSVVASLVPGLVNRTFHTD